MSNNLTGLSRRVDKLMAIVAERARADEDSTALDLITTSLIQDLERIGEDGPIDSAPIVDAYTPEQAAIIERFCRRYDAAGAKASLLQELEQELAREENYERS